MLTFILPGGSPKNKRWLEETAANLKVDGFIRSIYWDHWRDEAEDFNPKEKSTLLVRVTKGGKTNIIAKSIGSLVAAFVIDSIPDQIEKVIFCGIPLNDINDAEKEIIKKAIKKLDPKNVVCFQNIYDPHATYLEVKSFLPAGIKIVSKDRSDHDYPYFEEFNDILPRPYGRGFCPSE